MKKIGSKPSDTGDESKIGGEREDACVDLVIEFSLVSKLMMSGLLDMVGLMSLASGCAGAGGGLGIADIDGSLGLDGEVGLDGLEAVMGGKNNPPPLTKAFFSLSLLSAPLLSMDAVA